MLDYSDEYCNKSTIYNFLMCYLKLFNIVNIVGGELEHQRTFF